MNIFCSFGAGGLLGITPAALRLSFGSGSLGLIYGLLYVLTSLGIPTWGSLLPRPTQSWSTYCGTGAFMQLLLAVGAILVGAR
eukprot:g16960.t1